MTNRIERKIQKLLRVKKTHQQIFDELTIFLFQKKLTESEMESIYRFAWNAGLKKQLASVLLEVIHQNLPAPWGMMAEILNQGKKTHPAILQSLIKGPKKQNRLDSLLETFQLDKLEPKIAELRKQHETLRKENHRKRKQLLLEKLEFYRNQRMIEEENKTLSVLSTMFPNDLEISKMKEIFQRKWAKEVISRSKFKKTERKLYDINPATKEEIEWAKFLFSEIQNLIIEKPNRAYNFAILFQFMGLPRIGLEALNLSEKNWAADWLAIDLMLECGYFVQCLDAVHQLELKYSEDPETTFAGTYARAKSLNGLGQQSQALDLLQSIVNVRPNYRSASSLLVEWTRSEL